METRFFGTPADFRAWLESHHEADSEIGVILRRKSSDSQTMTWSQAVDQALCFGWIDGVGRTLDPTSWVLRFTPRKPRSTWSAVNIRKVAELTQQGLMRPAGLRAFSARREDNSAVYSYENPPAELDGGHRAAFERSPDAWEFFQRQPPSYRKVAIWWVVSAKKEETRLRRLATLIDCSARGERLAQLSGSRAAKGRGS